VNPGLPAVAEFGLILAIAGAAGLTMKFAVLEATPPGLITVTPELPAVRMRLADTDAANCVPLI
jgi:hypothetical protein